MIHLPSMAIKVVRLSSGSYAVMEGDELTFAPLSREAAERLADELRARRHHQNRWDDNQWTDLGYERRERDHEDDYPL
jgi:hypothetical protein